MAKPKKRDSAYYRGRLEKDYPAVFADLTAGRFKSVEAASIAAGLRRAPTPLSILKREWKKASHSERAEFVNWLKATRPRKPSTVAGGPLSIVGADGKLLPAAKVAIQRAMALKGLRPGELMVELGFSNLNMSVQRALYRDTRLNPDVIGKLVDWLADP